MKNIDNIFKRHFTKILESNKSMSVFDLFKWKRVNIFLKDHKTGKILYDIKDLEFPDHFSQTACDIIATKYLRKSGVPDTNMENSFKMIIHRLVSFWISALKDENLIKTKEQEEIFYDEIIYALIDQRFAPNSPQWFNTGLALAYGIKGEPQDTYYYDINKRNVVKSKDSYTRTQASACFIISIKDSLLGPHSISEQYTTETKLFKFGSGTGTNFSPIRATGEKLSGGGSSSGLMSFLRGLDRNAGAIKSGGTTRRAAKMVCLDIDHPEIEDFINWKCIEEDKVRALTKMGYDGSFEGEAYNTVSGQNSNNSVRISDDFMEKVELLDKDPNSKILLKGRVDSSVNKYVNTSYLWDIFNEASHKCADPAPLFDDRFNAWHTCPAGEDGKYGAKHNRINSTNPCAEYAFLDDTSCNLASINVLKFYDKDKKVFNIDEYLHMIHLSQLILEASIHFGQFPTEDIARKTHMFRTTGLGICNIASLFMVMGIPYDSEEARALASGIVGIMTGESYFISSIMAKEIGAFEKYDINKKYMLKVIRNHARVAGYMEDKFEELNYTPIKINHNLLDNMNLKYISSQVKKSWRNAYDFGEKYGYRNAQVSVIAPTGTISFAMDASATSIEPFFSHIVYKKLSGGGYLTLSNPMIGESLKSLGYTKSQIEDIINYIEKTETIKENGYSYERLIDGKIEGAPHLKEEHLKIFDTANTCGTGVRFISPEGHVKMVAALTPLVSGSISKTINLPNSATIKDFKNITLLSWKLGIKGISLYRDGSKFAQPLNKTLDNLNYNDNLEDLNYNDLLLIAKSMKDSLKHHSKRNKPIGIRSGTTHPAEIDDIKIYTTVNRNKNNEICEIYITTDREGTLIMGLLNSLSKSLSVMLQHKVPPQDISAMLRGQKYEPHGFVKKHPYIKHASSISDLISKIIDIELNDYRFCQIKPGNTGEEFSESEIRNQNYIDEKVYDKICTNCSSTKMFKNGTCYVCGDCGSTTGCS